MHAIIFFTFKNSTNFCRRTVRIFEYIFQNILSVVRHAYMWIKITIMILSVTVDGLINGPGAKGTRAFKLLCVSVLSMVVCVLSACTDRIGLCAAGWCRWSREIKFRSACSSVKHQRPNIQHINAKRNAGATENDLRPPPPCVRACDACFVFASSTHMDVPQLWAPPMFFYIIKRRVLSAREKKRLINCFNI